MTKNNDLAEQIEAAKQRQRDKIPQRKQNTTQNAAAMAMAYAGILVASVVVGVVLGIGIDTLAGTEPWALLIFLFFGICAGFVSIFRAAKQMEAEASANLSNDKSNDIHE